MVSEYIVEYPDDLIAEGYAEECINIHERITRCRDCKHYDLIGITQGWWPICARGGNLAQVDPNGYCAWGEPEESR